jgi:hypothetical protein
MLRDAAEYNCLEAERGLQHACAARDTVKVLQGPLPDEVRWIVAREDRAAA